MSSIKQLLDEIFDQANPENDAYDEDLCYFFAENRGNKGWWAVPFESRWFYDEGEYLGQDGLEALATLKYMGFYIPEDITIKIKNKVITNRHKRNKK